MSHTIDNKRITITISKNDLFNTASLKSSYIARTLSLGGKEVVGNNATIFENYAISEDEKDAFIYCLKSILPDIYDTIISITHLKDISYEDDDTNIVFNLVYNKVINVNIVALLEVTLEETIVTGVLMKWWDTCSQIDLYKKSFEEFENAKAKLSARLYQLRKRQVYSVLDAHKSKTFIKVQNSSISLKMGEEKQVSLTIFPLIARVNGVAWSTKDATIASVDNGLVKALKVGSTIITATSIYDNEVKADIKVTIQPNTPTT